MTSSLVLCWPPMHLLLRRCSGCCDGTMLDASICGHSERRCWGQQKQEPAQCRSPVITAITSSAYPELDPLTLLLCLVREHVGQDVVDDPILVELVALLFVFQTARAPLLGLAAPMESEPLELPSKPVCLDARHASRDVVEDPMVVEVVASLPIIQPAKAPIIGPPSPMLAAPAVHDALASLTVDSCASPHMHGHALDSSWDNAMVSFINAFKLPLKQPLIMSPPRLRVAKDLSC